MSKLPPFKTLLKSRDVEDPFHRYVHRPLAYAFVALIYRTPITPNGVTLLGMLVGIASGVVFLMDFDGHMLVGGLMFWASAIIDDADGMLARAKNMQSQLGRAFDGTADMIVGIATVIPVFLHLWWKEGNPLHLILIVPAILSSIVHFNLCDFYREHYLGVTKPKKTGSMKVVDDKLADIDSQPWHIRFVLRDVFVPYLAVQALCVRLTNPAMASDPKIPSNEVSASIWKKHNKGPMKTWAMISHAPHNEWLAFCAMFDRVDIYLWVRVVAMNIVFFGLIFWQRRATAKTLEELRLVPEGDLAGAESAANV